MPAAMAEDTDHLGDGSGTLTVAKPAAFAAGQILIFDIGDDGTVLANLTAPAGWLLEDSYSVGNSQGKVWSHPHDVGDPATWDFGYNAGSTAAAKLYRITGADLTPVVTCTHTSTTTSGSTMDSPSVDPVGNDDLLIASIHLSGANNAFSATKPTGMTDLGPAQVIDLFMAVQAAWESLANGDPTAARTWTGISPTGKNGGAFSIAVRSVAAPVDADAALSVAVTSAATAAVDASATAALSITTGLVATAAVVGVGGAAGGGWQTLIDIGREAAQIAAEERSMVPVACPNDGEPLVAGPQGVMHCPYDGWQYPRDWIASGF